MPPETENNTKLDLNSIAREPKISDDANEVERLLKGLQRLSRKAPYWHDFDPRPEDLKAPKKQEE